MWNPLVLALVGCSGGPSTPPTAEEPPPKAAGAEAFECPAGSRLTENQTSGGAEKYCDRDGVMQGPYIRYYSNGNRAAKGMYDRSEPDGDWTWWHENEAESQKGKYAKGRQVGSWTRWYPSGQKEEEGDYLSGRKAGTWTSFYESGRKKEFGSYHNDMKNATWTYLFDDEANTVHRTEVWELGTMKRESIVNKAPPSASGGDGKETAKGKGKAKG